MYALASAKRENDSARDSVGHARAPLDRLCLA